MTTCIQTIFPCFFGDQSDAQSQKHKKEEETARKTNYLYEETVCGPWKSKVRMGENGLIENECCCCWVTFPPPSSVFRRTR